MLIVGKEWLVDAAGCDAQALRDVKRLRAVFARVIAELDLHVVGEALWHKFPPPGGGITGLVLLAESHLTCHTYPEFGVATFNFYCCRAATAAWPWAERLAELLGATTVQMRVLERSTTTTAARPDLAFDHPSAFVCEKEL